MTLALPAAAAHHLARVLRVAIGDHITLFDGSGAEFTATVSRIDRDGVVAKAVAGAVVDRESPLRCTLAQAVSSGERMDYTLQKAVELGVAALQPLFSERSVVQLDPPRAQKRHAHWQQVAIAACEQCGRNLVPAVAAPLRFVEWVAALPEPSAGELRLMLSPRADQRLADLARPTSGVTLLAGPEGGFSPVEIDQALAHGFAAVRLGPRVLRTETAALAALAAMQVIWGDF